MVLLGAVNYVETCPDCKAEVYGGFNERDTKHVGCWCPKCESTNRGERRELRDSEHISGGTSTCSECQEWMKKGIVIVGAQETQEGTKLTGRFCVIKDEAFQRMPIHPQSLKDSILQQRAMYVPEEVWVTLGLPMTDIPAKVEP